MKKILFALMAVIFCTANYSSAATYADGKEKDVDKVSITIGDWKINGKVNGKIYLSDEQIEQCRKKNRAKLGDSEAVTYADGTIIVNIDEDKINKWVAEVEKWADEVEKWADEVEKTYGNCEITIADNAQSRISRIKGSGNIISKSIPAITGYDAIKASRSVSVVMTDTEGDQITIKADDNVMPYVLVEKEGNSLIVGIDKNITSLNSVHVEVTLPKNSNLNELKAASAATININTTIESRSLSMDASSAAKINISKADVDFCDVDATSAAKVSGAIKSNDCYFDASSAADIDVTLLAVMCDASASSAAKIRLKGQVATFDGDASSAAKIDAKALEVQTEAEADASSGAKITVNAIKKLDAEASSGGVVSYVLNDKLDKRIKQSSGGRVKSEF